MFPALCPGPASRETETRDFGSSLKRLKWDPKTNAAVETKRTHKGTNSEAGGDDVIRVETSLVVCDVLVLDQRGQNVSRLTKKDFIVTEDSKEQEVVNSRWETMQKYRERSCC
jgi:hypothetical protein